MGSIVILVIYEQRCSLMNTKIIGSLDKVQINR